MLSISLLLLYNYIIFNFLGYWLFVFTGKVLKQSTSAIPGNTILVIAGYSVLTFFLSLFSFFFKISWEANLAVVVALVFLSFTNRTSFIDFIRHQISELKNSKAISWILYIVFFLIVVVMSLKSNFVDSDTGFYHAQVIQWIEKYPAIKGLANLFPNLAFNNSSFLVCSFFSFTFLHDFPYHTLNSFFLLTGVYYLISKIFTVQSGSGKNSVVYLLFLIFIFMQYRVKMTLPFPDMLIGVMGVLLFLFILEKFQSGRIDNFDFNYLVIIILIATSVTIKISALPFFLYLFYLIFHMRTAISRNQFFISGAIIVGIMIPWMIRSVVLSGYLIFPIYELDFFNFDWELPIADCKICIAWIASYAKITEIRDSFGLSFFEWFPIWIKNQNTFYLILVGVVPAIGIILVINRLIHIQNNIDYKNSFLFTVWIINFCGVVFWFFTAPDFRFGIFSIITCFIIGVQMLILKLNLDKDLLKRGSVLMLVAFTVYAIKWPAGYVIQGNISLVERLIVPEPLYRPVPVVQHQINGAIISFPAEGQRCWNEPIPCTCYKNRFLRLRSNDISDGFKSVPYQEN